VQSSKCLVCSSSYEYFTSESKDIPGTGRGGLYGCEMLRIQHCLDNRLTDGDKFDSLTLRPRSAPQNHYFYLLVLIYVSG
jgi:hypothetical protein